MLEHSSPELVISGLTILLGFVVVPLWLAMGLADYFCHRASDIEHTSGTRESVMHLVQYAFAGLPLLAALFLRIDAGLLLVMVVFAILHHGVAYIDVRYANAHRRVTPVEQMIHSFLEIVPITALLLVSALDFAQIASTVDESGADFALRIRTPPLPLPYLASVLAAAFVVGLLPYLDELVRCVRARRTSPVTQPHPTAGVSI